MSGARKYARVNPPPKRQKMIAIYFRKHKDDKVDDEDDNEKEKNDQEVPKWDSEFLKVDQGTLFGRARNFFYRISYSE